MKTLTPLAQRTRDTERVVGSTKAQAAPSVARGRVTLLTPTYGRDLERFKLLRESMERTGIDLPHVAVVQTEDVHLFRDLPHRHNLTVLTTADVLPAEIERRRCWKCHSWRHPMYWLRGQPHAGWMTQQVVKLASPTVIDTEAIVCLDSDVLFIRRLDADDFFDAQGCLRFFESSDTATIEEVRWQAESMEFFGIPVRGVPARQYVDMLVPLRRDLLLELQAAIAERGGGRSWAQTMIRHGLTEYTTYGVFARQVKKANDLWSTAESMCMNYWNQTQAGRFQEYFLEEFGRSDFKAVMWNATMQATPGPWFRPLIEEAWGRWA